jgi:drug/metabolite transporter (DMT)-like permease
MPSAPERAPAKPHHRHSRAFQIGFAMAVANTIIGATQPVLTRYAAVRLDPILFCAAVTTIAALCALPILYHRGELAMLIDRRRLPSMLAMSMLGTVATSLTMIYGLRRIDAIAAVILLQTEPVYSLILSVVVVGERPSVRQLIATAVILMGIGSVFYGGNAFSPMLAALLLFVTPLLWQSSHVIGLSLMPPLTPIGVTGARFIYAACAFMPIFLMTSAQSLSQLRDPTMLLVVCATGFFVYFLSALTWYGAISRLSLSWTTALVVPGIPLLSMLFAMLFLGERPTAREIIGVSIAIGGVLALVIGADPHRNAGGVIEAAEAVHQPIT